MGFLRPPVPLLAGAAIGLGTWALAELGFSFPPVVLYSALGIAAVLLVVAIVSAVRNLAAEYRFQAPIVQRSSSSNPIKSSSEPMAERSAKAGAETFIILSTTIARGRLNDLRPAWEIEFVAFNGGLDEIRIASVSGSFKIAGKAFRQQAELLNATSGRYGEIVRFTVQQWIDSADVPKDEPGQNHLVLQLTGLRIMAIATNSTTGLQRSFAVPLPEHLQFNLRNHWQIGSTDLARFYSARLEANEPAIQSASAYAEALRDTAIGFRDEIVGGRVHANTVRFEQRRYDDMVKAMPSQRVHSPELANADKTRLTSNQRQLLTKYQSRQDELDLWIEVSKTSGDSNQKVAASLLHRLQKLSASLDELIKNWND